MTSQTTGWNVGGSSQRLSGWMPGSQPNDRLLRAGRVNTRARARELRRNSGWGERAVSALTANLVGTGIRLQVQAMPSSRGRQPSAQAKALASRVEELWEEWASDPKESDVYGDISFYAQQSVLLGCVVEHGEVLIRRRRGSNNETVDLRLQGIEPDWIAGHLPDTKDIVDGIAYHQSGPEMGRLRAVMLHRGNPYDPLAPVLQGGNSWEVDEVPAEDILHVRRITSPGQRRGVPWLASVAVSLHDLSLFRDAALKRQQIAAMLAMFVTDSGQGQTIRGVDKSPLFSHDSNGMATLESATVVRLGRGEQINVPTLPHVQGQAEWAEFVLREIASGLGLSYEAMTGDLRGVNFSSARMGALMMRQHIDMLRESVVRSQLLLPVWRWWRLGAQAVLGRIPKRTIRPIWVPPRRHQVDPVRETNAQLQRLRTGLASLRELITEEGRNPDDVLASVAATAVELDALGLSIQGVPGGPAVTQLTPPQPVGPLQPPTATEVTPTRNP